MTFYNHIENARYRCIERFNCQGQRGASDKAYVGESLDQARCEYDRLQAERDHLKADNAKLTKLARWMYQVMDESCATHYPYEPAPVSMQALMRAEKELQALGIEVDG